MLRKIVGSLIGLVLVGFGVALIGGWLDPEELTSSGGSRRGRFLRQIMSWLTETLGAAGAGAVLCVIGLILVALAFRSQGDKRSAAKAEK